MWQGRGPLALAALCGVALVGCGAGEEPDETTGAAATVEPDDGADSAEAEGTEAADESGEAEEAEPTPIPASSDGPAQNWPEPEVPDEIYEETPDGAIAVVEAWFEARNYLQLTGDDGPLWDVSSPECEYCEVVSERLVGVYESGDFWYVIEDSYIEDPLVSVIDDGRATVLIDIFEGKFAAYENGELYGKGGDHHYDLGEAVVEFTETGWQVHELAVRSSED
ncbi:hypothetical protein GCM10027061_04150 [Nesterenkonia suensis]